MNFTSMQFCCPGNLTPTCNQPSHYISDAIILYVTIDKGKLLYLYGGVVEGVENKNLTRPHGGRREGDEVLGEVQRILR